MYANDGYISEHGWVVSNIVTCHAVQDVTLLRRADRDILFFQKKCYDFLLPVLLLFFRIEFLVYLKVKVKRTCIAPLMKLHLKRSGMDHTGLPLQTTPYLPLPCKRSPDGAT